MQTSWEVDSGLEMGKALYFMFEYSNHFVFSNVHSNLLVTLYLVEERYEPSFYCP